MTSRENLLDANLIVYFLPIISMAATLILIRKDVSFDQAPGFDRLSGLMAMVGCSFVIALAIQKTNVFVFFGASIKKLFILAAAPPGLTGFRLPNLLRPGLLIAQA